MHHSAESGRAPASESKCMLPAAIAAIRKALDGMEPAAVAARLEALEAELQQGSEQLTALERRLQHQQIRDRLQKEQA